MFLAEYSCKKCCRLAGSVALTVWMVMVLAIPLRSAPPQTDLVDQTAAPPILPFDDVRWVDNSFWQQRLDACAQGTLPTMSALMFGTERSHFIENFRIAAGFSSGRHRGPAWNDGDTYKWLEAMTAMWAQTKDPHLLATVNEAIDIIAAAQRDDGYLHTPVLIAERNGDTESRPFGDPVNFEMYNIGHLLTAASVHFSVTGERKFLDVAIKAADFLDREFSEPNVDLARHAICPAHYMGAIDLYRATGEPRYLQLCERWLSMRSLVEGGDDNQDRLPFIEQREAVGHAVRANYLYAGAADLYFEKHDPAILATLQSCWHSVQQRKIYITGGCGALFDGASPDGAIQQSSITRVHQAYGRNYQLPNSTAHNETCAAIGNVLWNYRMWRITRQAEYIDALENSLYNAVLAGVSLDGKRFFYTNTLRQLDSMPTELRWSRERQEWISCYCCPPNVARTVAEVGRYAYSADNDSAYVLLYGSNHLDTKLPNGTRLELTQQADYPDDGRVVLTVGSAPAHRYALHFRIPGWCQQAQLSVNGVPDATVLTSGSFAQVARAWKAGDRVELELSMPTKLVAAHPLVEECRGQVAVCRGPLVYCVETSDLPKGRSVLDVRLPADGHWEIENGTGELDQIPLLRGELEIGDLPQSTANTEKLYHEFKPSPAHRIRSTLIPYFAWGNRGKSEMSVWLPVHSPLSSPR